MSYSKLIHEYLDGALDAPNEEALFSALARDVELREEFNQQVKLQLIAQNDMSSISPPYETTNSIFSNLGFAVPADLANNQSPDSSSKLYSFFKKHFATITLILLFSSLSTLSTIYLTNNNDRITQNNIPISYSKSPDEYINNSDLSQNIENYSNNKSLQKSNYYPNMNSSYLTDNNSFSNRLSKPNNKSTLIEKNNSGSNNSPSNSLNNNRLINANANFINKISTNRLIINNLHGSNSLNNSFSIIQNNFLAAPNSLIYNNFSLGNRSLNLNDFSVEITGLSSQLAAPNLNLPSNSEFFADNFSLSGHYRLNNSNLVGISVGRENFPQTFKYGEFGDTYHQNPTLFYATASLRYELSSLKFNNILIPYGQIAAGATSIGPVFKGNVGIVLLPYNNFSFTIGAEISSLLYNVSGKFYSSEKVGLTYGVKYNF